MAITPEDRAFERLASKFPKRYRVKGTQYIRGILKGLAEGDAYIETQVEAVRDNLIAVTAVGRHLDRRAGLYGVTRGRGAGVIDEDFQKLIPALGMSPKQITHILLKIIDIMYGPYASRANVTAGAPEPYDLEDLYDLRVRVDDTEITITFEDEDFVDINAATAQEIATAISNRTKGRLVGSVLTDARTSERFINIRTSTLGSQGFVQVLGGEAQRVLQFPEIRPVTQGLATWDVTRFQGTDEMVYTHTAGPIPDLKAAGVVRGDFVTIRADSGFDIDNTGTYEISFVDDGVFRIINPEGVVESGITQSNVDDFTFYRPDLGNVLLSQRPAAIVEVNPKELTVLLPVTSPITKRTLKGGHHFHGAVTRVTAETASTITLDSSVGFPDPAGVTRPLLDRKLSSSVIESVSGTTITLLNSQNWPAAGAIYSNTTKQFYFYDTLNGDDLENVTPTPPTSIVGDTVHYVEHYLYTGVTGNQLTGVFPDPTILGLDGKEVATAGAEIIEDFPGSFLYDPNAPFTASELGSQLSEDIFLGDTKTLLLVDDVADWPDTGSFVLEFGTHEEEGPIKYLSKIGDSALIVDPSHIFQKEHLTGTGIRLLRQIGAIAPRVDGSDFMVYTTSTSPARDLLAEYLRLIAASGISFRFIIKVPEQKWEVIPNLYSTDPLADELVTI